jgi:hypothetical protein
LVWESFLIGIFLFNPLCSFYLSRLTNPEQDKNWREESKGKLSELEEYVIWGKGTEMPGTGKFNKFYPPQGFFACKVILRGERGWARWIGG